MQFRHILVIQIKEWLRVHMNMNMNNKTMCKTKYIHVKYNMHPKLSIITSVTCRGCGLDFYGSLHHPNSHFGALKRLTRTPRGWSMLHAHFVGLTKNEIYYKIDFTNFIFLHLRSTFVWRQAQQKRVLVVWRYERYDYGIFTTHNMILLLSTIFSCFLGSELQNM